MCDQERIKEIMVEEAPGFREEGISGRQHRERVSTRIGRELDNRDEYLPIRQELVRESRLVVTVGAGGVVRKGVNADQDLQNTVLEQIPKDEGISRPRLFEILGGNFDNEEDFYEFLSYLRDMGKIYIGPGKGGVVYRVQYEAPEPDNAEQEDVEQEAAEQNQAAGAERDLYEPLIESLRGGAYADYMHSGIDRNNPPCVFVNSAVQGRANTGGTWTRPDITIVTVSDLDYFGRNVEVTTIEVKPASSVKVDGVYEALAHTAQAHKVYLFQELPLGTSSILHQPEGARIRDECARYGVGLITFYRSRDQNTECVLVHPDTWSPEVTAASHQPDLSVVQGWLKQCIRGDNIKEMNKLLNPNHGQD